MKEYGPHVAFVDRVELENLRKLAIEREEFFTKAKKAQADFINYQDRVRTEREELSKYAVKGLLKEMIAIRDYMLMCLMTTKDEKTIEAIKLTDKEFLRIFSKYGVVEIKLEVKKQRFDPVYHEAISVEETMEFEKDTIMEVLKSGYMLHDRVLRPTLVKVAKPKS